MKTTLDIPKPLASALKQLTPSEMKEVIRFALFLKTRGAIDLNQTWFWTRGWQKMERAAARDKKAGRVLGDGTVEGLLRSLH